jgi:hypothetical protein
VRLLQRAGLESDLVRLSDFLPAGSPAEVQRAASAIVLGYTPRLASQRNFSLKEVARLIEDHPSLSGRLIIPVRLTAWRTGWPVPREALHSAIIELLKKKGWQETTWPDAAVLRWPQEFTTRAAAPELEADNLRWDIRTRNFAARIRCVDRYTCADFLAYFPAPPGFNRGKRWVAGRVLRQRPQVLARAGQTAMLTLGNGPVRISLPVVCLERGTEGQTIRVRDAATRRVLRARVVGAGRLRADY